MNEFKAIYKILKYLVRNMGDEDFNMDMISADTLHISENALEQIMIELQRNGYIEGVVATRDLNDKFPHIAQPMTPRITLKGMEYLNENAMMKKMARFMKGVKETIPGI